MDMNQYLEVFIDESKEHLQSCSEKLLQLEESPGEILIVNEIFRSAHTLKGMSATMGYEDLANLTHQMENVLDLIRNQKLSVTQKLLDVLFSSVEYLDEMVMSIASGGDGKKDVSEIVRKLQSIEVGGDGKTEAAAGLGISEQPAPMTAETYDDFELTVLEQAEEQGFHAYEITVSLQKDCLLKAARVYMVFEVLERTGEIIKSAPTSDELEEERFDTDFIVTFITKLREEELKKAILNVSEVRAVEINKVNKASLLAREGLIETEVIQKEASASVAGEPEGRAEKKTPNKGANPNKTIRVNIERLDTLMNLFEELVIDRGRLEQISKDLKNQELQETVERMSRVSADLQTIILNMRMVPVETVFNRFPGMVRQLARSLDKKIRLEIIGAETELDRTVIDEIGDPLVHLLRNAVDHGIEEPAVRSANGKPEEGTVSLKAFHNGNHVFIEIGDDGDGISKEKVLKKAISKGIITEKAGTVMTDRQVYDLIFSSGFSTAEVVSDVSGRGVGLDVVKNKIASLGGSISIDTRQGAGSVFSIQLPLTLSIISVMLVQVQDEKYAVPLSSIIETAIIKREQIMEAHNQRVIDFRGKIVPLIDIRELFQVPVSEIDETFISLVIVKKGDKMAGLIVDSFIGQQEIVLKSLGNYLKDVHAISGATILGDGQVALIIDCNALFY